MLAAVPFQQNCAFGTGGSRNSPQLRFSPSEPEHITHAETVLEPDPSDISALRKLGAAVLVRAFGDARTDSRARQWFEVTPQPMLTFWCQIVGLDVGTVRRRAREFIRC